MCAEGRPRRRTGESRDLARAVATPLCSVGSCKTPHLPSAAGGAFVARQVLAKRSTGASGDPPRLKEPSTHAAHTGRDPERRTAQDARHAPSVARVVRRTRGCDALESSQGLIERGAEITSWMKYRNLRAKMPADVAAGTRAGLACSIRLGVASRQHECVRSHRCARALIVGARFLLPVTQPRFTTDSSTTHRRQR